MRVRLGLIGIAAVIALAGCASGATAPPNATPAAAAEVERPTTVGGYEGWWNATPLSGDVSGLPQETVAVNTRTGQVVDAFNRSMNDAGKVTNVADVDFTVVPDPAWPADSVVIIETATGDVIESFPVNQNGEPIYDATGSSNRERPHGANP
ncbi:hypothetical protein [Arthrobacter sp. Alg241-R88]|uniref:hypothetical protein n=1 Tax=Arthrobacter sp. Alg241-R88 TaxID=2305984 RepID=UPI0013D06D12|nr:hypothetical protein [Arthrobacter sp. Alg241-R88]